MKKKIIVSGLLLTLAAAVFWYLPELMFQSGLSNFYAIAPGVPDTCTEVVRDAAIAFSSQYDYAAWVISAFLVAAAFAVLLAAVMGRSNKEAVR
jgi:hypothetical protein